jgi:hypothetical protein
VAITDPARISANAAPISGVNGSRSTITPSTTATAGFT